MTDPPPPPLPSLPFLNAQVTLVVDGDFTNLGMTVLRMFRHSIGDLYFDYIRAPPLFPRFPLFSSLS